MWILQSFFCFLCHFPRKINLSAAFVLRHHSVPTSILHCMLHMPKAKRAIFFSDATHTHRNIWNVFFSPLIWVVNLVQSLMFRAAITFFWYCHPFWLKIKRMEKNKCQAQVRNMSAWGEELARGVTWHQMSRRRHQMSRRYQRCGVKEEVTCSI